LAARGPGNKGLGRFFKRSPNKSGENGQQQKKFFRESREKFDLFLEKSLDKKQKSRPFRFFRGAFQNFTPLIFQGDTFGTELGPRLYVLW